MKRVEGDILGEDYLLGLGPYPSGWSLDDLVWGYAAPVSGLSVADNELKLTISPFPPDKNRNINFIHQATVTLNQAVPYYTVENQVFTWADKRPTYIRIDRKPGSRVLQVYGNISEGAQPDVEEIAIDDPAEYAAMAFKQMLIDRGIPVTGTARASHALEYVPGMPLVGFVTATSEPIANLTPLPQSQLFPDVGSVGCGDCNPLWAYKLLAKHVSAPLREEH